MARLSPASSEAPATRTSDGLRVVLMIAIFGALAWAVVTRYTANSPWDPYRSQVGDFFQAARAHDSTRIRLLVDGDAPIRWAASAVAQVPSLLPSVTDRLTVQGGQHWADTTSVLLWGEAACPRQAFFVTFVEHGRNRRIRDIRTECVPGLPIDSARP